MSYLSETYEINSDEPADVDIVEHIGKPALIGYIASGDGDITVRINGKASMPIPIETGEQLVFERADEWEIKRIILETESVVTLSVRVLLKP